MEKEDLIIKYYEDTTIQNPKIIFFPKSILKGQPFLTDVQIFDSIVNDTIWNEDYNPSLGFYLVTDPETLEKKELDFKTTFPISEPLIFIVKRKFPFEHFIDEMVMSFGDQKLFLQHVDEIRATMDEKDRRSLVGLRYYDVLNKGYVKLKKNEEIPMKNAMVSGSKMLVLMERRHEREVDDFLIIDEEIDEEKFVFVGTISNEMKAPKQRKLLKIVDHIRTKEEELKRNPWLQVDIPIKSMVKDKKLMDQLLINGIPGEYKKEMYLLLSEGTEITKKNQNYYIEEFKKVFSTYYKKDNLTLNDVVPFIYAEFGGNFIKEEHILTEEGSSSLKRILCVIGYINFDIEFCPVIIYICSLLLCILSEEETFYLLNSLLIKNKKSSKYFRINKIKNQLFKEAFKEYVKNLLPNLHKHFTNLNFDLDQLSTTWFDKFFHEYLPFDMILHLLDIFIKKGGKAIMGFSLGILKQMENELLKCNNSSEIYSSILTIPMKFTSQDELSIFKHSLSFNITQKQLVQMDIKNKDKLSSDLLNVQLFKYIRPKVNDLSDILIKEHQWEILYSWLPYKEKNSSVSKVFSTLKDGYNLDTLMKSINSLSNSFLFLIQAFPNKLEMNESIKIRENAKENKLEFKECDLSVFGAFCGEPFGLNNKFEGAPNTFLFSLLPIESFYKWTQKNEFLVFGKDSMENGKSRKSISFGAGGEGPGLFIDDDLFYGSSYQCETFENQPLCGKSITFTILKIEIYKFT